jgi:hypothetical protein
MKESSLPFYYAVGKSAANGGSTMSVKVILSTILALVLSTTAFAANSNTEFDPFSADAEKLLNEFDAVYERETGLSAHLDTAESEFDKAARCYRQTCAVWAQIVKSTQTMYLYIDGSLVNTWKVSTGTPGRETPNFDTHPDGRIYNKYTSTKYPEGDYNGLGNMPYAVFIRGGFAIHGTPRGNWSRLGRKASHGCIRVHPDNGQYFNSLVRSYGVRNVWITVQN